MKIVFFLLLASSVFAEGDFLAAGEPNMETVATKEVPDFRLLAKKLSNSVVNVSAEIDDGNDGGDQPYYHGKPGTSLGSGFFISPDGYIATNHHVIAKATKVTVRLYDSKEDIEAKVIGSDEKTDLALIKITTNQKFQPLLVGNSDNLEVGEWVIAIGNQFQLGQTVTAGIVSAKSRKMAGKTSPYDDFIQTDASINPGSSGGPLINTHGQVVGINTAIYSPGRSPIQGGGFNIGIGFAIPINLAARVLGDLKQQGKVTRGFLGVMVQEITLDLAKAFGLPSAEGALVADVTPGSPAELAGMRPKDIILSFNKKKIVEQSDLPRFVADTPIGTKTEINFLRDKNLNTIEVTIAELPSISNVVKEEELPRVDRFGMYVQSISASDLAELKLTSQAGVQVLAIDPGTVADVSGLIRGDVILEVNNQPVLNLESYKSILEKISKDDTVLFMVKRKEGIRFITLKG